MKILGLFRFKDLFRKSIPKEKIGEKETARLHAENNAVFQRQMLANQAAELIAKAAGDLFGESSALNRDRDVVRLSELLSHSRLPEGGYWDLSGGVMRMSFYKGKLILVDPAWSIKSRTFNGTYEEHWNQIKQKYEKRIAELLTQLGFK